MPFDNDKMEASFMSVPCEVAVKCVLPVVRAMVAKELTVKYGLKQMQVAGKLGISQPAVSLYYRRLRGKAINLEGDGDVRSLVSKVAHALARNDVSRRDLILKYCEICKAIRAKGLLCELHKAFDPTVNVQKCRLCYPTNSSSCI